MLPDIWHPAHRCLHPSLPQSLVGPHTGPSTSPKRGLEPPETYSFHGHGGGFSCPLSLTDLRPTWQCCLPHRGSFQMQIPARGIPPCPALLQHLPVPRVGDPHSAKSTWHCTKHHGAFGHPGDLPRLWDCWAIPAQHPVLPTSPEPGI